MFKNSYVPTVNEEFTKAEHFHAETVLESGILSDTVRDNQQVNPGVSFARLISRGFSLPPNAVKIIPVSIDPSMRSNSTNLDNLGASQY